MANPLSAQGISDRDYAAAVGTMVGEAGQEGVKGMAAVGDVVSNRLADPAYAGYGSTISEQVKAENGRQFNAWSGSALTNSANKAARRAEAAVLDPASRAKLSAPEQRQLAQAEEAAYGVWGSGELQGISQGATRYANKSKTDEWGTSGPQNALESRYGKMSIGAHTFTGPNLDLTTPFDTKAALDRNWTAYQNSLNTPTEQAFMDSPMARANPVGVVSYGEALPDLSPGHVVNQGAPLQDLTPGAYQTIANDNTGWGMGLPAPTQAPEYGELGFRDTNLSGYPTAAPPAAPAEARYGDLGFRDTKLGDYPSAPAGEAPTIAAGMPSIASDNTGFGMNFGAAPAAGGFAAATPEGGWSGDGGFHSAPSAPMGSTYGTPDTNTGWGGKDFDTRPARDLSPYGQRQPGDNWSAEQQGVADRRAANDPMAPSVSHTSFGMGFTPQTPAMDRYGMEMSDRYRTMDVTPEARPTMGDYSQEGRFHAAAPANDWSAASSAPEHYGTIASDETGTGSSSRTSPRSVSPYGFSSMQTTPMASPTPITGLQPLASAAYDGTVPASPPADPYGMPPTTQQSVTTPRSPTFATNPYAFSMPTAASFAPAAVHSATVAQQAPQGPQLSQWGQDNGVTGNWSQDTSSAASNARISQLGAQTIDPLTGRMMETGNGGSPAYSGYTGNWSADTSVAASNARTAQTGAGVDPVTGQQIETGGWGMNLGGFFSGGGWSAPANGGNTGDGTGGLW